MHWVSLLLQFLASTDLSYSAAAQKKESFVPVYFDLPPPPAQDISMKVIVNANNKAEELPTVEECCSVQGGN